MATSCRSLQINNFEQYYITYCIPDRASCCKNVEVLEDFRKGIKSHDPETPESYPDTPKNEGDKRRGNCEEINHGIQLKHKNQLVIGGYESHEEVGHEEDIEDEVKL